MKLNDDALIGFRKAIIRIKFLQNENPKEITNIVERNCPF